MEESLRAAVIQAYRQSLLERYDLAYLEKIPGLQLAAIEEATVYQLRAFFLNHLYPEASERAALDGAFAELKNVIASPRKLLALIGTAGRSLFKLGTLIPSALSAGLHTAEAVVDIRKLENRLTEEARKLGWTVAQVQDTDLFKELVRRIPRREIERFRKELNKLFLDLANRELLRTTLGIMEDARNRMAERTDLFSASELAGIDHGLGIMKAGLDLFNQLSDEQIQAVHQGVNAIELHWYDALFQPA
ncbi:MAG: hypothetical protein HS115_14455 [Spirochaetales bacterium]|nr:hypothetical protein [Spirochaetales bacterium]